MDEYDQEYEAWHQLCDELKPFVGDINAPKCSRLVAAIRVWGEELAILRRSQVNGPLYSAEVKAEEAKRLK